MTQSTTFVLTPDNAQTFRPKGGVKVAVLNDEPATYDKPTWGEGGTQRFDGPHMTVAIPRSGAEPGRGGLTQFDVYGSDISRFLETHEPVKGTPNGFRKVSRVLAVQLEEDTPVLTEVDGRFEATTTAPAGHWLLQQEAGEQQAVEPAQFDELYERVD